MNMYASIVNKVIDQNIWYDDLALARPSLRVSLCMAPVAVACMLPLFWGDVGFWISLVVYAIMGAWRCVGIWVPRPGSHP